MDFSGNIAAWNVSLSHSEVEQIATASWIISQGVPPPIGEAIALAAGYIRTVDALGGNNGVNISGVHSTIIVTPRSIPIVANAVGLINSIISGALGGIRDAIGAVFGSGESELFADVNHTREHEKFVLVRLNTGKVAILAHRGYFCADHARRDRAVANRSQLGPWEQWDLIRNDDNTVSFRSDQGKFLCAQDNKELWANRERLDTWEKFDLIWHGDGKISLKARVNAKFVRAS